MFVKDVIYIFYLSQLPLYGWNLPIRREHNPINQSINICLRYFKKSNTLLTHLSAIRLNSLNDLFSTFTDIFIHCMYLCNKKTQTEGKQVIVYISKNQYNYLICFYSSHVSGYFNFIMPLTNLIQPVSMPRVFPKTILVRWMKTS